MKSHILWVVVVTASCFGCAGPRETREVKYQNPYHRPLFSPGGKFGGLPPAVQNTVRAEVGAEEIADTAKEIRLGKVIYVIFFKNAELLPPLYVGSDGSVLNPDLTVAVAAPRDASREVPLSELPSSIARVLHERVPEPEIASITKETWGDRMMYIVTFKDQNRNAKLYIGADGTVLKEVPK